ncbi:MAG: hypothetical protein ACYDD9_08370 [Acidithiobacillus sp.]|uniref:Uncharacterized protein n=1 Tax=Acidithiobacillus ferruginosus TaxID=3063951 RepID=A0ACD5IHY0_9PROT
MPGQVHGGAGCGLSVGAQCGIGIRKKVLDGRGLLGHVPDDLVVSGLKHAH